MQMEGLQCWSESNSGIVQVIEGTTTQLSCVDIIEQQDSIDDGDTLQVILFYRGEELRKPGTIYPHELNWIDCDGIVLYCSFHLRRPPRRSAAVDVA